MSLVIASVFASLLTLKHNISNGRSWWNSNSRRTEMTAPATLIWSEVCALSLTTSSVAMGIIVKILGTHGAWMVPAGLGALGTIGFYYLSPILRTKHVSRHRISLSKNGIELTRIDGHTDEIPWNAHPRLRGIRQGYAIITIKNQDELRYPIGYLPMSMRQLERILNTFSTSTRLRTKLSGPEALSTVLSVLEPTEEELTDGSWTWHARGATAQDLQ